VTRRASSPIYKSNIKVQKKKIKIILKLKIKKIKVTFCKKQEQFQLCIEQFLEKQVEQDQSDAKEGYTIHHYY
jgi:hypothetical protein